MSTTSYTVPSTQAISLNLPATATVPLVGGKIVWSAAPALGTVVPANDGTSALFTPGSTVYTLTQALVNTASGALALTSVAASSAGTAAYTGTITGGAANAFVGMQFVVAAFTSVNNNGTFICTASTATVLTLSNGAATVQAGQTATATALATYVSYLGALSNGAANGLAGVSITVAGFTNAGNNGTFTITSSSATAFGVTNATGVNETHAATGTSAGVLVTTVTATVTPAMATWVPGRLYRVNDQVVDTNGHTQKVTAGTRNLPTVYTPNAGVLPQGGIAAYSSAVLTLTSVGNASNGVTVYTGTITGGGSNAFATYTVNIAGFATAANNGSFVCTASTTTTITLSNTVGVSETHAANAALKGIAGDPLGLARVLGSGGGAINGDWPAGAVAANSGNTKNPYPSTAAAVGWVAGGYSGGPRSVAGVDGPQQGISSPASFGTDSRVQIAGYSETGPGGLRTYIDAAGNSHTGWQIAGGPGTVNFNESLALSAPTFSTVGGAVVDGEITWTDQGTASTTSYATTLTVSATAGAPLGYYVNLG